MSLEFFTLILVVLWGACVGSFLNVVIYRVPAGLSVVSPPSRCPGCERKLAAYDNVPVLGWLWLRGRCRYCRMRISPQYPLVELATAVLLAGLTYVYFFTDLRPSFAGAGVAAAWPVLMVHLVLVAMMIGATMIDAKLFIIPLSLPWIATAVAVIGLPLAVGLGWVPTEALGPAEAARSWEQLVPYEPGVTPWLAVGGCLGLLLAVVLLRLGVLPLSFADEVELPEGADPEDPNMILHHPHPRREIGKELLFVMFPVFGMLGGLAIGQSNIEIGGPVWPTVGGVLLGYLVGGGIVWATRILGTLGFGKEAMGLGDVHLMAAVGAVIGWRDVTLAFFVAPFFGIVAALVMAGAAALLKGRVRVIPYGPYLCAATLVVMVWRVPIWSTIFIQP
jgi:leader peptidase (prepilin peptidase)/N-methyltransferase